ncbi:TPA: hypothetical protein HA234_05540, partial [Candidatus Woesearchaeota archaeon]|nr:hypothetical protein [Candidatus Woesearchaeota archaeon]
MKQKGQAGIEALFAIGVIVILFIGIYAVYNDKSRNLLAVEQELRQREVCVGLANDIVSVFTLGEGTEKTRRLEYNV